jgi:adenylosuccinate lyase
VLGEAIQTVLRQHGVEDAYEQLKALTRGRSITRSALQEFLETTALPADVKLRLASLTPEQYVGIAAQLARDV